MSSMTAATPDRTASTSTRPATAAPRKPHKPFVQIPEKAATLPLPVVGFLRLIIAQAGYDGYTTKSVKRLAELAGISRKTAFKYFVILREADLVSREWVDGEYRTYHADQWGHLPTPADGAARHPRVAQAPPPSGAPGPARNITTPRGVFRRETSHVNVSSATGPTIEPACIRAPAGVPTIEPACIRAPAGEGVLPPAEAPPAGPVVDGIDPELDGLSDAELDALIARLSGSRRRSDTDRVMFARLVKAGRKAAARDVEMTPTVAGPIVAAPPNPPVAAPPGELKFETILGRVKGSADPQASEDLARRLAKDLRNDFGSLGQYRKIAELVRSGRLKPKLVFNARAQARSETAENPGAVFTRYLQNHAPELFPRRRN